MVELRPSRAIDPADRLRIEEALIGAEADGTPSLALVVLGRSSRYPELRWRLSILLAAVALLAAALLWPGASVVVLLATQVIAMLLANLILCIPGLQRALLSEELLERRVDERAARAFAEQGLAAHPQRAGILIFLSLFERRATIWADEGAGEASDTALESAMAEILRGIESRQLTEGLIESIRRCREFQAAQVDSAQVRGCSPGLGLSLEEE